MLGDERLLPEALRVGVGVLEVTSATPAGVRVRTGGAHPVLTGFDHLERLPPGETRGHFRQLDLDELSGESPAHEGDPSVLEVGDTTTGGCSFHAQTHARGLRCHHVSLLRPLDHPGATGPGSRDGHGVGATRGL